MRNQIHKILVTGQLKTIKKGQKCLLLKTIKFD
jgi:hypothetical protein